MTGLLMMMILITTALALPLEKCEPGSTWQEDCNICSCSEDGVAICTMIACEALSEILCIPGVTWQDDCNTCFCSHDGRPICTEIACPSFDKRKCEPGTTWMEECNICVCSDSNLPSCTEMACLPSGEKPGRCPAPSDLITICIFDPEVNCIYDKECSGEQKCCPDGCNKICKKPIL